MKFSLNTEIECFLAQNYIHEEKDEENAESGLRTSDVCFQKEAVFCVKL
jgi:hypothetical protein